MTMTLAGSLTESLTGLVVELLGDGGDAARVRDAESAGIDLMIEPEQTVPFNALDELCFHLNTEKFAWTIELEVRAPGAIDEGRLRRAVAVAASKHPMARARQRPYKLTDRRYDWEIMPVCGTDPVWVLRARTDAQLDTIRQDVLSAFIPLDQAPPFRVWLVRRDGGDSLILTASHVATDGMGAARLLRSIVRAYAGVDDLVPPVEPEAGRDLVALAAPATVADHVERAIGVGGSLRRAGGRLARIARDGGEADAGGFRFHHHAIPAAAFAAIDVKRHGGATVNDVLLAALHLAIGDWNADHAEEADRISVMMPINMRPTDSWQEGVGNVLVMVPISTRPEDREDASTLVNAVRDQTERARRTGTGTILIDVLDRSHLLPSIVKRAIPLLSPLSRDLFIDTAVLSNLGRIDEPFDFGPGPDGGLATELWFSPPARMPLGVGVGAVMHRGDLFLSFRCCQAQFDEAAAAAFADCFTSALLFVG